MSRKVEDLVKILPLPKRSQNPSEPECFATQRRLTALGLLVWTTGSRLEFPQNT